jgi:pimeloyl-ACP methyl ester carboxylesterase
MFASRKRACLALVLMLTFASVRVFSQSAPAAESAASSDATALTTKDGVELQLAYLPSAVRKGTPQAKQVTPVVLLHDYKSTHAALMSLAAKLQAVGAEPAAKIAFAVVLVDLRAHGESNKLISPQGETLELDAAKLNKDGFYAMASLDMEAVRHFLVDKNDEGELNLNKLCIVGSGMGASVGVNWALQDWTAPPLAVGKQGQDVKGLVLISPQWTFNGLSMQDAMKFAALKKGVSWLLVCGMQDSKAKTDCTRIQKLLERFHPETAKSGAKQSSGLLIDMQPSALQGDMLLSKMGDTIEPVIVKFLSESVAAMQYPWSNRRGKLP